MATIAVDNCLNVEVYAFITAIGRRRKSSAAAIVARKHALPDALSQLSVYTAPYGAGEPVTGGTRSMALCNPGIRMPFNPVADRGTNAGSRLFVKRSNAALIGGSPHTSTNATNSRYGSHAENTSRPE